MSEGILLASVGVSIGIAGYSSDEGVAFGISITFRVDIYIFDRLPSENYQRKALDYKPRSQTKDEYIAMQREALANQYHKWSDYVEKNQNDANLKIIRNQEDLNQEILKVGKEQYLMRANIEKIIYEMNDFMSKKSLDDNELKQCYIILSNAYQLIRDLSITFGLGEMSLRSSMDCSDDAESISEKWISNGTKMDVLDLIIKRRQYSREIEKLTNIIIDNNNDYVEYSRNIESINNEIESLNEKLSRVEKLISLNEGLDFVDEKRHIENIIEKKGSRLEKYEGERLSLQTDIQKTGFMGFSKKKSLQTRLEEVEKEINDYNLLSAVKNLCLTSICQSNYTNFEQLRDIIQSNLVQSYSGNWWVHVGDVRLSTFGNVNQDSVMIFNFRNSNFDFHVHVAKLENIN